MALVVLSLAPLVCAAGVFPRSPLGVAGYARGGRPLVARPPAGPAARAPRALSPSSRPSPVFDARCRLARYPPGCAVPNVSCGRPCRALPGPLPRAGNIFVPGLGLTARASRPRSAPGALPPPQLSPLVCMPLYGCRLSFEYFCSTSTFALYNRCIFVLFNVV